MLASYIGVRYMLVIYKSEKYLNNILINIETEKLF